LVKWTAILGFRFFSELDLVVGLRVSCSLLLDLVQTSAFFSFDHGFILNHRRDVLHLGSANICIEITFNGLSNLVGRSSKESKNAASVFLLLLFLNDFRFETFLLNFFVK
jgi:hypothetical protein